MDYYTLKAPLVAAQYRYQQNEQVVMGVVASTGRSGHSHTNARGRFLYIYNGGPELTIDDGRWAVAIGSDVAILTEEQFSRLFEPITPV